MLDATRAAAAAADWAAEQQSDQISALTSLVAKQAEQIEALRRAALTPEERAAEDVQRAQEKAETEAEIERQRAERAAREFAEEAKECRDLMRCKPVKLRFVDGVSGYISSSHHLAVEPMSIEKHRLQAGGWESRRAKEGSGQRSSGCLVVLCTIALTLYWLSSGRVGDGDLIDLWGIVFFVLASIGFGTWHSGVGTAGTARLMQNPHLTAIEEAREELERRLATMAKYAAHNSRALPVYNHIAAEAHALIPEIDGAEILRKVREGE